MVLMSPHSMVGIPELEKSITENQSTVTSRKVTSHDGTLKCGLSTIPTKS